jgi:hypothetical protein
VHGGVLGGKRKLEDSGIVNGSADLPRPGVDNNPRVDATAPAQHESDRDQRHRRKNRDTSAEPAVQEQLEPLTLVVSESCLPGPEPGR